MKFGFLFGKQKKPKVKLIGVRVVWGVPNEMKELRGVIPGKRRYRFRNTKVGEVFVRGEHHFRHYLLLEKGTHWEGMVQGQNTRTNKL